MGRRPLLQCSFALVALAVLSLMVGAMPLGVSDVVSVFLRLVGLTSTGADAIHDAIVLDIRLPRLLMAGFAGASLAVSGALLQGLFRNPLADAGLLGVSSGAALAVAITIVALAAVPAGLVVAPIAQPAAAFGGGAVTTFLVARLATLRGQTSMPTMLLAGIALNALAAAGLGLLLSIADDAALRDITFWILGSLGGVTWTSVVTVAPLLAVALIFSVRLARSLDAMAMGEHIGIHLGVEVETVKRRGILLAALAVGATVAICGAIGFVGLVVPHLWRLWVGPHHQGLLTGSAVLGAALLIGADLVARVVVAPAELPVGVITALAGAPFFIWLLWRAQRRHGGI